MTNEERSYKHSALFIFSGIYDTLEFMGGKDTETLKRNEVAESHLNIYGKPNHFRFTVRPLPFGCSLQIQSLNPDKSLSVDTEHRLISAIFTALEQLIEDAFAKRNVEDKSREAI
jgi:hypothetical protein